MTNRPIEGTPAHPGGWPGAPLLKRAERLDPEAGTFLQLYNAAVRQPVRRAGLRRARRSWRLLAAVLGRAGPVARIETLSVPGPGGPIELRLYRPVPRGAASPAFVWFHGGGFMMGEPATADTICRHVASVSGAVVVAVRYRLLPEHDLYAGREDAMAALDWLVANASVVGIDAARLAIGGDSAGGNLAAVVAQRCASRGMPALRLQVLAYPATNLRDEFPSKVENATGYLLTTDTIDWIKSMFTHADLADPWLSPIFARDLRGLPPALVVSAGFDPIRDEGLAYAARLREAGVPVELLHYPGQFHGFLNFDGVLRAARDALDRIGIALRDAFHSREATGPPDRTLEIRACPRVVAGTAAARVGRTMLIAGLMTGERFEQWCGNVARAMLPGAAPAAAIDGHPLLNPMSALRARLARHFAPLEARETYRGSAARPVAHRAEGSTE